LLTDRLVRAARAEPRPIDLSFAQVYYASNLDAFPGSRKEKKAVSLKRITGIAVPLQRSRGLRCV
jgi:hypothetical protein